MSNVEGGGKSRPHNLDLSTIRVLPEQRQFDSGVKKLESLSAQAPKSREFLLLPTQPAGKEVTQTDLALLGFYSLLSELLVGLYPDQIGISIAPIDRRLLREKVKQAYDELVSLPKEELPKHVRQQAKADFKDITDIAREIEATPREAREELLREHKNKREYLTDQTLEYLDKLR